VGASDRMRFGTLDGLRGLAAILILFYHLGNGAPVLTPSGYLAVDLFFALSGFVLSHAYEARLRDGFTLREFALVRLIRVYPMALVGAAIGVFLSSGHYGVLLLPDFGGAGALYPVNVSLWSLAFELIVNFAYAALAVHLNWRGLGTIMVASGVILMFGVFHHGNADLGSLWPTAGYGIAGTIFPSVWALPSSGCTSAFASAAVKPISLGCCRSR
jgi:peptidoglycan/LPS O-acetylase OafA/YrhL